MKYQASINIMPLKEILDPQGKSVELGLKNLHIQQISNIRIGKHITLLIEATDEKEAKLQIETACKKLLANVVMEEYQYSLKKID